MKHVFFPKQDEHWHAWRDTGIGSSDAPVIAADAGLCKPAGWMKPIEAVWRIKTGRASGVSEPNWGMRLGIYAEPLARAALEQKLGILFSTAYGEMDEYPFVHSSFDGRDITGNVLAEIKYASAYLHNMAKGGHVVSYYRPQVAHHGLTAWGMPETWRSEHRLIFASYNPETDDLAVVDRSALEYRPLAERLINAEIKFWQHVEENMEPLSDQWRAAAFRYRTAALKIKELKKDEESAKAILIDLAGDNDKKSGAGVSVSKQFRQGGIDIESLLTEIMGLSPEEIAVLLEKYRLPETESMVVRAGKLAA